MPALEDSGTKTSDGTEQTLSTLTTAKTFVLVADLASMVDGDEVELRVYYKCLSGGTERLAYYALYENAQADPMKFGIPVPSDISYKTTLKKVVGSNSDFPWKVLSI